jgi:Kef-type K+ transport system membrane component KefB/nucleotide-binding universal stress UspA family protein
LAGQQLWATVQVTRTGTASGTLHAGGEPIALSLTPVDDGPPGTRGTESPFTDGELAGRLFLAVAAVIVVSRFIGLLFTRVHQPRVMGEIVAGILLGPSLLGAFYPALSHFLFPPEVIEVLRMMAQFGLIFFMFLIGLELDTRLLRGSGHVAVLVSHVSIVLPFCLGALASLLLFPLLGSGSYVGFTLFMGTAMAITAFPVLARILTETGLHRTRLGAVSITCAAVDDITAWCVLAVVVAIVKSAEAVDALRTISLALLFVGVMLFVVRPIATRLAIVHEQRGRLNPPIMAGLIVALFLSAWSTEQIGIHAIFGAFMLGAVVPRFPPLVTEITTKLEDVTVLFLLPIFFTVVGLSTRIGLLDRASLWMMAALVVFLAILGKLAGSMIAARAAHQSWRDSTALGLLLNTRGLTEIVVLTIGRGLGVVSPALFTMLVLMALVTTFMTTPLLALVYPRRVVELEAARAAAHAGADRQPSPGPTQCILVAVGDALQARSLLSLVNRLGLPSEPKPGIVLAHVTPPPGRDEVRTSLAALEEAADAARVQLVPLAGELLGAGFDARVRVRASSEPAEELAQLAAGEGAQLVLLGRHRSYVGHNELGGVVRHTLERLGCDAAVLLDRPNHQPARAFVAVWYRRREDLVALHLAARLAIGGGETLHVFQPDGQELGELTVPVPTVAVEATGVPAFVAAAASASLLVVSRWEAPDLSAVGLAGPPVLIVQPGNGRRYTPRGHKDRARILAATTES